METKQAVVGALGGVMGGGRRSRMGGRRAFGYSAGARRGTRRRQPSLVWVLITLSHLTRV